MVGPVKIWSFILEDGHKWAFGFTRLRTAALAFYESFMLQCLYRSPDYSRLSVGCILQSNPFDFAKTSSISSAGPVNTKCRVHVHRDDVKCLSCLRHVSFPERQRPFDAVLEWSPGLSHWNPGFESCRGVGLENKSGYAEEKISSV